MVDRAFKVLSSLLWPSNSVGNVLPLAISSAPASKPGLRSFVLDVVSRVVHGALAICPLLRVFPYESNQLISREEKLEPVFTSDQHELVLSGNQRHSPPGCLIRLAHGFTHYYFHAIPGDDLQKPLVVFLHGASVFSFIWDRLAKELAQSGYRVLVFDFYGHGFSDAPKVDYTLSLFRNQFVELLRHLGLEDTPRLLVGHSMGGLVASDHASRHPDLVSKLVLLNAVGFPIGFFESGLSSAVQVLCRIVRMTSWFDKTFHILGRLLHLNAEFVNVSYSDICRLAEGLDDDLRAAARAGQLATVSKESLLDRHLWSLSQSSTGRLLRGIHFLAMTWAYQIRVNRERAHVLLSTMRNFPLLDGDHSDVFHRIGQRPDLGVLVIWGEEDSLVPPSLLKHYQRVLPNVRLMRFEESDHSMFLQKSGHVLRAIDEFFGSPQLLQLSAQQQQAEPTGDAMDIDDGADEDAEDDDRSALPAAIDSEQLADALEAAADAAAEAMEALGVDMRVCPGDLEALWRELEAGA